MIGEQIFELQLPYPGREDRLVRVFVPEHEENETLPAIYMTDGQNLFDVEHSGFGCWYTREAVRDERRKSGKACIIVGIHNNDPQRENDLTPASVGKIRLEEAVRQGLVPRAELFDDFLVHTVMSEVQRRFPVKTGRENTAFCGSSCGGLFSFFTALSHPELFGAAGVLSPAFLFYSIADVDIWIRKKLTKNPPRLLLYSGGGDELERDILSCLRDILEILDPCYPKSLYRVDIRPERRHHETAWEPVFREFLHEFLNP